MNNKLSASTIIICGIVRDCGKNLEKNIRTVASLCAMAKDYRVVIFENDSKDNSKQILQRWADSDSKVFVSLNDFGTITIPPKTDEVIPAFSTARIGKMANYRNFYLDYIEQNNLEGDYVVIVDFDIRKIDIKGIINSFSLNYEWDAITANGISYAPSAFFRRRFYDTYAFVECGRENIPQTEENIKAAQYRWAFLKAGMPPIRVASAFGGLAIYRREAIEECRYKVLLNNDEKVESRAEHYFFHRQMAERGYDKIFVNPSMTVYYQTQVWNTIKKYHNSLIINKLVWGGVIHILLNNQGFTLVLLTLNIRDDVSSTNVFLCHNIVNSQIKFERVDSTYNQFLAA